MANIIKKFLLRIAVVPYQFCCRQRDLSSREEKGQRDPQISPQSLAGEAVPQPFCLSAENTLRSTNRSLAYYPIETEDIAYHGGRCQPADIALAMVVIPTLSGHDGRESAWPVTGIVRHPKNVEQ